MTNKEAIEILEKRKEADVEIIKNGVQTDFDEFIAKGIEAVEIAIKALSPKPISYKECSDAMMKMWMENVLTDGEYNRIMDRLNKALADGRIKPTETEVEKTMTIERAIAVLAATKMFDKDNPEDYEAISLAIEALEKQIPRKPCDLEQSPDTCLCSSCCTYLVKSFKNNRDTYCKHCGQAIDWSEE